MLRSYIYVRPSLFSKYALKIINYSAKLSLSPYFDALDYYKGKYKHTLMYYFHPNSFSTPTGSKLNWCKTDQLSFSTYMKN